MRQIVAYLAVSVDGYIATKSGSVSWLDDVQTDGDTGFEAFFNTVDTVVMGRTTYDWIAENAKEYPYKEKHSIVVTHRHVDDENNVMVTKNIEKTAAQLKEQPGKNIWVVGGGKLISYMLRQGLIDRLRLTVAPVLLGSGIPLFTNGDKTIPLTLEKTTRYGEFIELDYSVTPVA